MKRGLLRAALLAVAATAAVIGASCTKKKAPTLYLPAGGTDISIQLRYPLHAISGTEQSFSYVCEDAKAFLVSLDVDSAATIGWDYHFLLGLDGQLWGCAANPAAPCADQHILSTIPKPYRIAVEGIDVAPESYTSGSPHNVACRGVADSLAGMGQLDVVSVPTPTPSTSPVPGLTNLTVTAVVPMLRPGDMNGTFSNAGAIDLSVVAGLLGPSEGLSRRPDGGIGVFADRSGNPAHYLEFDPRTIAATSTAIAAIKTRAGARTAGFLDSAGRASLLIVGGAPLGAATPIESVEIYRSGTPSVEIAAPIGATIGSSRPVELIDHVEGLVKAPAIAIIGGGYMSGSSYYYSDRCLYFFPSAPTDLVGCLPGSTTGSPSICTRGSGKGVGDGGHAVPMGAKVKGPSGDVIVAGLGYIAPNFTNTTRTYAFAADTDPTPQPVSTPGVTQTLTGRGVPLTSSLVAFFGGFDSGAYSPHWSYFRGSDQTLVGASTTMLDARYTPTQYRLPDGRVLLAGGYGPTDPRTVEEFVPAGGTDTAGSFVHLTRSSSKAPCVATSDPNCVRFTADRANGHSAFQILGSSTWINGSVVFVGGATTGHGNELFVPAYDCSGDSPIRAGFGDAISEADFCDRNRAGIVITDPGQP